MPTKTAEPTLTLRGVPDTEEVYETIGEDWLRRDEVARAFGKSVHTITYWISHKGLPTIHIREARGYSLAFRLSKLIAWADRHGLAFTAPPTRS